jgi:hypothetical protein
MWMTCTEPIHTLYGCKKIIGGLLSPLVADCSITMVGYRPMPSIRTEKEKGLGVNGDKMNTTKKLTIYMIK